MFSIESLGLRVPSEEVRSLVNFDRSLQWIACEEHGQGLMEYALVIVLIGIVIAGVIGVFTGEVGRIVFRVADQMNHI